MFAYLCGREEEKTAKEVHYCDISYLIEEPVFRFSSAKVQDSQPLKPQQFSRQVKHKTTRWQTVYTVFSNPNKDSICLGFYLFHVLMVFLVIHLSKHVWKKPLYFILKICKYQSFFKQIKWMYFLKNENLFSRKYFKAVCIFYK